jgi:hypothetical protein
MTGRTTGRTDGRTDGQRTTTATTGRTRRDERTHDGTNGQRTTTGRTRLDRQTEDGQRRRDGRRDGWTDRGRRRRRRWDGNVWTDGRTIYIVPKFRVRQWDKYYNVPTCRPRDDVSRHPLQNPADCSIYESKAIGLGRLQPKKQATFRKKYDWLRSLLI